MRNVNCPVFSAADSSTSPQNSSKIDCYNIICGSFQIVCSAAGVAGVLKVQASNDISNVNNIPADFTPTTWTDVANATITIASGASGLITISTNTYRWLRCVWTKDGGGSVGTITVNFNGLGY